MNRDLCPTCIYSRGVEGIPGWFRCKHSRRSHKIVSRDSMRNCKLYKKMPDIEFEENQGTESHTSVLSST